MTTAIFVVIAAICAIGWLVNWVGNAALGKWIIDKGHTPPTDKELGDCVTYVWRQLLRIK